MYRVNTKPEINYSSEENVKEAHRYALFDFKKANDSIRKLTLFRILEEKGMDRKTQKIIEQTLTDTKSRIKFKRKFLRPFDIKTGVR